MSSAPAESGSITGIADPRYPIGKFQRPAQISAAERSSAVEVIRSLPQQLRSAVANWTNEQLDTPYRDGGWTVRQLVHHIADSHGQSSTRLRKALTEDNPTIQAYNEKLWADLPDDREAPVEFSLTLLEGVHARWAYLLDHLSEEQWQRTFQHPESGPWTIDAVTQLYAWHSRHHLAHITELAKARGW
ncbi:YfiT family bacillithiol transferase [Terriglobus aquaticus]|uniref:YfiT family bacillithiol transferase n=1 Tax=Terriglobus aquaticus TaxID=940139 RepID=A0ABW9KIQ7_9BACT|nr:putative metal-dependent hydrolase [Terriglobus aquaticus]